jgi:hypothetical protein
MSWLNLGLAATGITLALSACFSPSYGTGGFACKKGECPEGYVCIGGVCRLPGATAADGPRDTARGEVRSDATRGDRSPGERARPDLAADRPRLDLRRDARVDGPRPDSRIDVKDLKDIMQKDLLAPDVAAPPLVCLSSTTLEKGIVKGAFGFDLIVDDGGLPHVIAGREAAEVRHYFQGGTGGWGSEQVAPTHEGMIALAHARVGGMSGMEQQLHALVRQKGPTGYVTHHTWRRLAGASTPWSSQVPLDPNLSMDSLDIAGYDKYLLAATTTTSPSKGFQPFRLTWGGSSWSISKEPWTAAPVYLARAAVGPSSYAFSAYLDPVPAQYWRFQIATHTGSGNQIDVAATGSKAPAPLVVDKAGVIHAALIRSAGTSIQGILSYLRWDGVANKTEQVLAGGTPVLVGSADIALDPGGQPHVIYIQGNVMRETHLVGSQWSAPRQVVPSIVSPMSTRLAVEPSGKYMHILYNEYGSQWDLHHVSCYTP